jgi:hypothetical protein
MRDAAGGDLDRLPARGFAPIARRALGTLNLPPAIPTSRPNGTLSAAHRLRSAAASPRWASAASASPLPSKMPFFERRGRRRRAPMRANAAYVTVPANRGLSGFAVGREPPLRVVAEVQSARRRSVSLGVAKHLREKLR